MRFDARILIGKTVLHRQSKLRGQIESVEADRIKVSFYNGESTFMYPAAFAETLVLQDEALQAELEAMSSDAGFSWFKRQYKYAVKREIEYIKTTGGKKYHLFDGERLKGDRDRYLYSFDTDSELHFPDGTAVRIWLKERIVDGAVISCEEFTITIESREFLGDTVEAVDLTAEQWYLLEALIDRVDELDAHSDPIAYELACRGRGQIDITKGIVTGQDAAMRTAFSQPITFIWGPPGTGKTTTLARIALDAINNGERVLMVSYSNVSVDGASLKVAEMADLPAGEVIRYGYPRVSELVDNEDLVSYKYVLSKNPELAIRSAELNEEKKKLKKKDQKRTEIDKELKKIRETLSLQEKLLIQKASFVATTVSKAVVDSAIYKQKFDLVIFDEASMAYVPQVVIAASLAKKHFCCLGDFRQLPAIVQNPDENFLTKDIFEHTGITSAVEDGYCHKWLVMLNYQYRMHPDIADFVSREMYGNLLHSPESLYESREAIAKFPPLEGNAMGMVDLSDTYSVCIQTGDGSRINLMSAMMCMEIAERFAGEYGVGIITPYSAQARLILAMIRDLRERDKKYLNMTSATVHQFQGSEKPVIIYDPVDCFRMPHPGILLTQKKNDTANRLFNVALTRTQGKFILVANKGYFFRKRISKDLMFTKCIKELESNWSFLEGVQIFEQIGTLEEEIPYTFLGDRDEVDSWERYVQDLDDAMQEIHIELPGPVDSDKDALGQFVSSLEEAKKRKVSIVVKAEIVAAFPKAIQNYITLDSYITTPLTVIDRNVIWFGEPLSNANFISEGKEIRTKTFPCLRFKGRHTARLLRAFLEL